MLPPRRLRALLEAAFAEFPSRSAVSELVHAFTDLGSAYVRLRRRRLSDAVYTAGFGSMEDLAIDCVADLFARDALGRLQVLEGRFEQMGWRELDDETLFTHTRRLVFRKVEDGLFRIARREDPSLSRLIRALKAAADGRPDVAVCHRDGRSWLCMDGAEPASWSSVMPPETFERRLRVPTGRPSATQLLDCAVDALQSQDLFARAIPLVAAAVSLRSAIARTRMHMGDSIPTDPEEIALRPVELEEFARAASDSVRERVVPHYVRKGLTPAHVEAYVDAAEETLLAEYDGLRPHVSQIDAVRRRFPNLSHEGFRERHRNVLEYIVKQVRSEFVSRLRCETFSADVGS